MLRYICFSFFITVFIFSSLSCSSEQTKPEKYYAVGQSISLDAKSEPEWTGSEGGIIEHEGEKYAWIKGEGKSKNKSISKKTAIGDAQGRVAESLKTVVASQFGNAWEAIGEEGEREDIEQIKQGLIASKTRLDITGFKLIKSHYGQVGKIKSLDASGKPKDFSSVSWQYIVMMGMPYDHYIKLRNDIINNVNRAKQPNSRQKKLIDKVEDELNKLDGNPDEFGIN